MSVMVSVIIPTYNSSKYISETLNSVLRQDFSDFEVVVVDDASTDDTCRIVSQINDPRIKLLPQSQNGGAGVSRNIGVEAAQGRYIAFLDSDDLWFDGKLSRQIKFMQENQIASCYTRYSLIDEAGQTFGSSGDLPKSLTYRQLLPHNPIRTSSFVYDAEAIGKIPFPLIRKRQDFGLFLEATKRAGLSWLFDEETAAYRIRSDSISGRKLANIPYQWEFYRDCTGLSRLHSSWLIARWFFRAGFVELRRHLMRLREKVS